ncbi:MAG: hypothetical protein ACYDEV_06700 [Acidiferrobacter sp.]
MQAQLKGIPCFVYHFVLTRFGWLNLVDRGFREGTEKTVQYARLNRRSRTSGKPGAKTP